MSSRCVFDRRARTRGRPRRRRRAVSGVHGRAKPIGFEHRARENTAPIAGRDLRRVADTTRVVTPRSRAARTRDVPRALRVVPRRAGRRGTRAETRPRRRPFSVRRRCFSRFASRSAPDARSGRLTRADPIDAHAAFPPRRPDRVFSKQQNVERERAAPLELHPAPDHHRARARPRAHAERARAVPRRRQRRGGRVPSGGGGGDGQPARVRGRTGARARAAHAPGEPRVCGGDGGARRGGEFGVRGGARQ